MFRNYPGMLLFDRSISSQTISAHRRCEKGLTDPMNMTKAKHSTAEFMFVVPALLTYLVFVVWPLIDGFRYSMTDWDGLRAQINFIGLENYINIFKDPYVLGPLKNTFIYALGEMLILNTLGLIFAVGLDNLTRGKNLMRSLLFVPVVLNSLVAGYIFKFLFTNPIADMGEALGIEVIAHNLLGSRDWALYMGILVNAWKMAGWYMVIYIAGLQSVDRSIYEAADIDGATPWRKFKDVTFPLIAPSFTINMVLSVERAFKEYNLMFALTNGGPGRSSEIFAMTIYNESFTNKRAGYGSALGIILFLIIVVLTMIQIFGLRRRENDLS
jgi:raffinose/stachyose/melibiose transport system permease protein